MELLHQLREGFNRHVSFREKRRNILQVVAPLYHEDGDMVEVFIDLPTHPGDPIKVSDHGLTLMRISYSYDIETEARRRILNRVLSENGVQEDRGRFYIETSRESLYPTILQFAQVVAKVSNIANFNREVVQSLFYENLNDFITTSLSKYHPKQAYRPIPERGELEVDWMFDVAPRHIFLFGVKGTSKARLAALACRELQLSNVPHRSVIVHDDFETGLSKKDQARITNAADKQFATLPDFKSGADQYFRRETEGNYPVV